MHQNGPCLEDTPDQERPDRNNDLGGQTSALSILTESQAQPWHRDLQRRGVHTSTGFGKAFRTAELVSIMVGSTASHGISCEYSSRRLGEATQDSAHLRDCLFGGPASKPSHLLTSVCNKRHQLDVKERNKPDRLHLRFGLARLHGPGMAI